jgi:AcrR family transcriptional regulator
MPLIPESQSITLEKMLRCGARNRSVSPMLEQEELTTRARILETIDRLFYRQGIRAVGVDTIVAELGISKKTLYRQFRSKGEMIEAYLRGRFRPFPVSDKPPAEQILGNFEWLEKSLVKKQDFRGCAFLNALAELGEDESEARKLAVNIKESRRLWFRDLLSQLDVDDPETLANQLSLLVDGAYSAALIRNDPAMTKAAISAARILLKNAGVRIAPASPRPGASKSSASESAKRRRASAA